MSEQEQQKIIDGMIFDLSNLLKVHGIEFFSLDKKTSSLYLDIYCAGVKKSAETIREKEAEIRG